VGQKELFVDDYDDDDDDECYCKCRNFGGFYKALDSGMCRYLISHNLSVFTFSLLAVNFASNKVS
jgi:hypothetical protein